MHSQCKFIQHVIFILGKNNLWVLLWGKGISEVQEFPFISKICVGFETQLIETTKYIPTVISETQYADKTNRIQGWKGRVPLILRGLVNFHLIPEWPRTYWCVDDLRLGAFSDDGAGLTEVPGEYKDFHAKNFINLHDSMACVIHTG
jgi:hypothetical protein